MNQSVDPLMRKAAVSFREATRSDVPAIVEMLADDPLGARRERYRDPPPPDYYEAFETITADPHNELVVAEREGRVVGVLQLTFIPYLTYRGGWRALVEGVRVASEVRGQGVGHALLEWAVERARERGCHLIQLTTDKRRKEARRFYERFGFEATHEGMKLHLALSREAAECNNAQEERSPGRRRADPKKALVRAFVEAVNTHDWDRLDALVAPGFIRHSHAVGEPGVRSRDALKAFLQQEVETFPDAHETLEDLVAEGDKVAARHRFHGTQQGPMGPYPPTGKEMNATYLAIYRIEGGQIAEAWVEWDNLSGLVQLGHHQPPA